MSRKDGGPAFSGTYKRRSDFGRGPVEEYHDKGMSLRDYFAAKALLGLLSNPEINPFHPYGISHGRFAERSYELADAMLAEREKGQ